MAGTDALPRISVVIPTYNRSELLRCSLSSLARQSLPKKAFEVIVVDDGSADDTREVCRAMESRLPVRRFYQANSGIAAAKNLGVFVARAPIVLFFDDDDVAHRDLLEEHLKSHHEHPGEAVAVLGHTTWHPSLSITPLMRYVTDIGQFLFAYTNLRHGQVLDFTYFWGGRSSCKRSLLVRHGVFRQHFRFGSEDIELGWRLSKLGLKVVYSARAKSFMNRAVAFDEFCRRCEKQGRSQYWFSKAHPDPFIRSYCMIHKAGERWRFVERRIESRMARIREIEESIASEREKEPRRSLLNGLYGLYGWMFNAYKIKGIVDEMHADPTNAHAKTALRDRIDLPPSELDHLRDKQRRIHPLHEKKNVLVCDPLLPMYDRASGSLRLFNILKSLVGMGHHVTFISRDADHAEQYAPILREIGIETYVGDPAAKESAGALVTDPYLDLKGILNRKAYHAAIISFWHLAEHYLPLIRKHSPETEIIVDSVDVHFLREIREAELKSDSRLRDAALQNKDREVGIYRKADRVWVVTPRDKAEIERLVAGIPVDVVPNIHNRIEISKEFEASSGLLFVGNFNHRPNADAVQHLCRDVLPLIRKSLPHVNTFIVGNNPPDEVKRLASDKVAVTGHVQDLSPYLKGARVSVCPMRYGAGMKGKIGEAMSWGLPVVTSSIGAEGMGLVDGHDSLIADAPSEFSARVIELYQDEKLWRRISDNGRHTVEANWSSGAVRQKIASVFEAVQRKRSKTSIIILTFNELEYTTQCVRSIQKNTPEPHEVILVDNGSSDGTVKWLRGVVKEHGNYRLVENQNNLGFARGCNQGIAAASGDVLVLLNNDVVVTEGWLSGMLECLHRAPDVGIVGPMTNRISGIQQVPSVGYSQSEELDGYAEEFRRRNRNRRIECRRIVGFCMAFRKRLIQEIGGLDESFGSGNFEDDDLCLRSILGGYRNMIAGDVFIHHFGSRTFIGNRIDYSSSISGNRKIFNAKWTRPDVLQPFGIRPIIAEAAYQAECLKRKGRGAEAVSQLVEAVRKVPGDKSLIQRLARLLIECRRFQEATEILREIQDGESAETYALLGRCADGASNETQALEFVEKTLSINPADVSSLCLKGAICYSRGDKAEAERCFEKAIEVDPSHGESYTNLGTVKWETGEREDAFSLFERGFILSPTDPDIASAYHSIVTEMGTYERAASVLREACAIHPDDRRVSFMYIAVLIQLEKHEAAMAEIERALEVFGMDEGVLAAALKVRERIGPKAIAPTSMSRPTLSVCMIAKNEEANIARCLRSIKVLADEVIVVDTGSQDRTRDIARILGARVVDVEWTNDFSAARNYSLSLAQGDWVLVLDADEVVAESDHAEIKRLIRNKGSRRTAFRLTTRNYTGETGVRGWVENQGDYPAQETGNGWFPSVKVRLFPRHPAARFANPVHEMVEPSLRFAKLSTRDCRVPVHHYGRLDADKVMEKGRAYYRLGVQKLANMQGDPLALRELASQAAGVGDYAKALELWKTLAEKDPGDAVAWMNAGFSALRLTRQADSIAYSERALAIDPALREATLNLSAAWWESGHIDRAAEVIERLLALAPDYPPALGRMAAAHLARGRIREGTQCLERLAAKGYAVGAAMEELAEALFRSGEKVRAKGLLDCLAAIGLGSPSTPKLFEECRPASSPTKPGRPEIGATGHQLQVGSPLAAAS